MRTRAIKLLKSLKYALEGITTTLINEQNFQIHAIGTITVVSANIFFKITTIEWCIILICIALVLSLELINTSIEYLVDLVSPSYHLLAKRTKDAAAGAVLIAAIICSIIAVIIYLPYIKKLLEC